MSDEDERRKQNNNMTVHFNIEKKMQKPSLLYYVLLYNELVSYEQ